MHGTAASNWKKNRLFGIGLFIGILVVILIGLYATYRANTNNLLSNSASISNTTDANLDVKVENKSMEIESKPSTTAPDTTVPTASQPAETNVSSSDIDVRVNGTPIEVPENGTVHEQIITENGSTKIDITSQSNTSSGDSRTRSSINLDVDSSERIQGGQ